VTRGHGQSFDPDGRLTDEAVAAQLRALGAEVVRAARQFQAEGTRTRNSSMSNASASVSV